MMKLQKYVKLATLKMFLSDHCDVRCTSQNKIMKLTIKFRLLLKISRTSLSNIIFQCTTHPNALFLTFDLNPVMIYQIKMASKVVIKLSCTFKDKSTKILRWLADFSYISQPIFCLIIQNGKFIFSCNIYKVKIIQFLELENALCSRNFQNVKLRLDFVENR